MMHLAALTALLAALQDSPDERIRAAGEAIDKARQEFRMSLVELGPDAIPALEKRLEGADGAIVRQAIEEIRKLREPIEKLVAQLSAEEIETRDQAVGGLVAIGRPAVPYLVKARSHASADVRARAETILRRLRKGSLKSELEIIRLKERAEIEELRVRACSEEFQKGLRSSAELERAHVGLLKAKYWARQIPLQECLTGIRSRLERVLKLTEDEYERGVATSLDVVKARIQLHLVDRRFGKDVGADFEKATRQASQLLRLAVNRGQMREAEALDRLLDLTADPTEDLD